MKHKLNRLACALFIAIFGACQPASQDMDTAESETTDPAQMLVDQFVSFRLTTDLDLLSENEKKMIPLLIEAAKVMNGLFLEQSFGPPEMAATLEMTPAQRRYFEMNYGPWDRIGGNAPFVPGVGEKPLGANLYPVDMTKEEFEAAIEDSPRRERAFKSLYTLIRRDAEGGLVAIPYHEAFASQLALAAEKLREAAALAEDPGLKKYLELRAEALITDEYQPSDFAWMEMKDNGLDVVIGAIETYEDQLFGYKAGFEAYVLVKDREWSRRLARYATLLPTLQEGLPVTPTYKAERPGTDSELNAYDAVYYAGESNAGSKTIAINLPNDEEVQLEKGTRRLQLKNTIQAKFEHNLLPISEVLIDPAQRGHISFDAFFENTMFHEVAHGLGIKNTIDGTSTVRQALRELYTTLEEGKADVLGLYMVNSLNAMGELGETHDVHDNMVTFVASIFRSIRFGATSAHGRANLIRFNFFSEMGAFEKDPATGVYTVNPDRMLVAMEALSDKILRLQGDGDYEGAKAFIDQYQVVGPELQSDLDRLAEAGIPVDIVFEQGVDVLGL
jgi:hypothetical protein